MVQFAKSHVTANPRPSGAMRELACVREEDAESGCHKVFRKYGLIPKVKVEYGNLCWLLICSKDEKSVERILEKVQGHQA